MVHPCQTAVYTVRNKRPKVYYSVNVCDLPTHLQSDVTQGLTFSVLYVFLKYIISEWNIKDLNQYWQLLTPCKGWNLQCRLQVDVPLILIITCVYFSVLVLGIITRKTSSGTVLTSTSCLTVHLFLLLA